MSELSTRREQLRGRDTRERVLLAAAAEFTEYGVAGARINRIAELARASKERIYAWFGDKDQLFDQVMQQALDDLSTVVPIDTDLVGYTVRLHDYFAEHPRSQRVAVWAWIHDSGHPDDVSARRTETYQHKLDVIRQAQALGLADPDWNPAILLGLLLSTATSWLMAPAEIHAITDGGDDPAARRADVERAAAQLVRPR
ncbi:TetR family transcriptional regulator [Subtercola frigoramans]|uniref:AcrR family transcriptional regulator n=1 Tax=Subtercola frigoramans TaxID=120298 RepID=A0ABS2L3P7_9MICO|nr:TetR family transcriptional regulator [Subtercola frigoramans]MBM7471728.1 AcrR family transcriptional regulator [Subtercola frigoramans]